MLRQLFRDAAIGRQVRKAADGILARSRLAGVAPTAIVDWSTDAGNFEIIVKRKGVGDGRH